MNEYGAWHEIGILPEIHPPSCRSDDLLGYFSNGGMLVVYYDSINRDWRDSEEGAIVNTDIVGENTYNWQAHMTHWCELPPAS